MKQASQRTLMAHSGGIGDFLLTCPALAHLAAEGPVELLGRPDRLALAVAGGLAERAVHFDAVDFDSLFTTPSKRLRAHLARFARAVVWMRDTGEIAHALQECGVPDVRVFPGLPPEQWERHASEYYLEQLGYPPSPPFRLFVAPSDETHDVVLHPGSGGKRKNWPLEKFQDLGRALMDAGRHVAWCTGPAEEEALPPFGVELLRSDSLVELAHILASAHAYVGNDSGVTHLAAAVGCRTFALFGPTNPAIWAPHGRHVTVLTGAPWPSVKQAVHAVLSE